MAELMRRTARQPVPGAPREFRAFYRDETLRLGPPELTRVRRHLLSQGRRNRHVSRVAPALLDALWRQVRGDRALDRGRDAFDDWMLDDDGFVGFARTWWPVVDAVDVLGWLRDPDVLTRVGEGVLAPRDLDALSRSWAEWPAGDLSVEDVALVDELRYLLGDPPERGPDTEPDPLADLVSDDMPELTTVADRVSGGPSAIRTAGRVEDDGYAHVLVDEAQDLSPMQWRMVARRGRAATWTVVGDPAQSSWPTRADADAAREAALGDKARHRFHLGTNYRNSKEIYEYAAGYAARAGLDADLPLAVRATGVEPSHRQVTELESGVRAAVSELARSLPGTVGVVVPARRRVEAERWLRSWPELAADASGVDARTLVLTGVDTKGLEFDGIVVVEPAEIEAESSTGRATLYVALTRATQRLVTVSER
jgi:hypothetical protein